VQQGLVNNFFNPPAALSADDGNGLSDFFGGLLDIAGKLWTSPNDLVGLAIWGLGGFSGDVNFGHNAMEITNSSFLNDLPPAGITFGNVINWAPTYGPDSYLDAYDNSGTVNSGWHEEGHTWQSEIFGPFYRFIR
jgi:hypothetical protein